MRISDGMRGPMSLGGLVLAIVFVLAAAPVVAEEPRWPPDERFAKWDRKSGHPPDALQFRLIDFAAALERHKWNAAMGFFDPQHLGEQFSGYARDLFKKRGSAVSAAERRTISLLYLYETLNVRPAPGAPKRSGVARARLLEQVAKVNYLGMKGSDADIWNIRFSLHDKKGRRIGAGVLQVLRLNLKFTGAVG